MRFSVVVSSIKAISLIRDSLQENALPTGDGQHLIGVMSNNRRTFNRIDCFSPRSCQMPKRMQQETIWCCVEAHNAHGRSLSILHPPIVAEFVVALITIWRRWRKQQSSLHSRPAPNTACSKPTTDSESDKRTEAEALSANVLQTRVAVGRQRTCSAWPAQQAFAADR